MPDHQQSYPGGPWKPAEPLSWAGGLDWEVARQDAGDHVACLYDKTTLVATLVGRNRAWLAARMWVRKRRYLSRRSRR